eukprot:g124.t1
MSSSDAEGAQSMAASDEVDCRDLEEEEAQERMEALTPLLVERRYKLVALDFDNTIVGVHTMGMWNGSLEELVPFVRPVFRALMREVAAADELRLAVVTFSGQVELVRGVLADVVGAEYAATVPIRGSDGSWAPPVGAPQEGKMPHLHSVWNEVMLRTGEQISAGQTILIDDDRRNIDVGQTHGVGAVWYDPAEDQGGDRRLLNDLMELE